MKRSNASILCRKEGVQVTVRHQEPWNNRPEDIEALKKRTGAKNQRLTPLIYAESDTRALVKCLSYLREISMTEDLDLNTLKIITSIFLQNDQSRAIRYYRMEGYAQFLEKSRAAVNEANSILEYRQVIEEALIYSGRINFWIDREIPWASLASTFSGPK
jgi:hypothetical protein